MPNRLIPGRGAEVREAACGLGFEMGDDIACAGVDRLAGHPGKKVAGQLGEEGQPTPAAVVVGRGVEFDCAVRGHDANG